MTDKTSAAIRLVWCAMTWIVIGLVLALASGLFGLPYALLFKPWRVKRLAYFLMARSPWYDRWVRRLIMRLLIRSTRKLTVAMSALVPAAQKGFGCVCALRRGVQAGDVVVTLGRGATGAKPSDGTTRAATSGPSDTTDAPHAACKHGHPLEGDILAQQCDRAR